MKKINFEDGVTKGNATTFNQMQTNIETEFTDKENKISNINKTLSEIVESGENENGSWIKWADGTMMCTCSRYFGDINCSTAWGALYESDSIGLGSFPQTFIDIPKVFITSHNISGAASKACFIEWVSNTTTTSIGTTIVARPTTGSIASLNLSITAIGKWK